MAKTARDILHPRLAYACVLLAALASTGVFGGFAWQHSRTLVRRPEIRDWASRDYDPVIEPAAGPEGGPWPPPPAQSRGPAWIFDAFTPPEIFYHAPSRAFILRPPVVVESEETVEPFGLELVEVRPEPFRLQLIGHAGGDGAWRGLFENGLTGEVLLAAAGRRLSELDVAIVELDVRPRDSLLAESMTTRQRIATARVHDERTGSELTLSERERRLSDSPSALVAAPDAAATREVRAGDSFALGAATYRIEAVRLSPASIDVVKTTSPPHAPERRTLLPRRTEAPAETGAASKYISPAQAPGHSIKTHPATVRVPPVAASVSEWTGHHSLTLAATPQTSRSRLRSIEPKGK